MNRVKSFDSGGVAPTGFLYPGDLNAIQDAVAAQTDYTQTIGALAVAIGEAGLQLLHYGSGEARLSGLLRVDGILRGLGGLYAGAFTTTQRDAIALGSRPYGLIILNITTNRIEWNQGTDTTPSWTALGWSPANGVSIANADVAVGAAIAYAKLNLGGSIVDADIASAAAIAYSKLALSNSIVANDLTAGAVTQAKLAAAVMQSKRIESGHVGSITINPQSTQDTVVNFGTAFSSAPSVHVTDNAGVASSWGSAGQGYIVSVSTSSFTYRVVQGPNSTATGVAFDWLAIGS